MKPSSIEKLESKGVATVQREIAQGQHGQPGSFVRDEVDAWIRAKESESDTESSSKRDKREEATLLIAKEANELAREANDIARRQSRWTKCATIIAAIAIIIAAIAARADIKWLISWAVSIIKNP